MRLSRCLLALPLLSACSLAYLQDHLGESSPDGGVDGGHGTRSDASLDAHDGGRVTSTDAHDSGSPLVDAKAESGPLAEAGPSWSLYGGDGGGFESLSSIWGSSATNVWAVGGQVVRWDGESWSVVPTDFGFLSSVWGSGPDDVWAVGNAGLIVHYTGGAWTQVDAGTAATTATLNTVWGASASAVWAGGSVSDAGVILHYNGGSWSVQASPPQPIASIAGSSASQVWAVGPSDTILEYTGSTWAPASQVSDPDDLTGVWAASSTEAWAVGNTQIFELQSTQWATYSLAAYSLTNVWGSSGNDVWAVGFGATLIHYTGGDGWNAVSTPYAGVGVAYSDIWGSAPNDVWIVTSSGAILHYH